MEVGSARRKLNLFFDVDFTLIATGGGLRPGTRETFQRLTSDGHRIYIWSGVGIRSAEVEQHDLQHFVSGVFTKPQEDLEAGLKQFEVHVRPDFVVDDDPRIVMNFGGMLVQPYYFPAAEDAEMELIYRIVTSFAETGCSDHSSFWPGKRSRGNQGSNETGEIDG